MPPICPLLKLMVTRLLRVRSAARLAALFAVLALSGIGVIGVTHQDLVREFWKSLSGLPVSALAGALFLIFGQVAAQCLRLWAIIPHGAAIGPGRVAAAFTAGECANIFTPARAGDALKVALMPIGVLKATGVVLADKIVDLGSLLLLCAIAGLIGLIGKGATARVPGAMLAIGAAVALILGLVGLRLAPTGWITSGKAAVRELLRGLSALKDPIRCAASLSFSLGAWIAELLAARVLSAALGFPLSAPHLLLALVILNASTSVPIIVANAGVYETALAYGLNQAGVPMAPAIAIATAHHVLELIAVSLSAVVLSLAYGSLSKRPPLIPHRRTPCASNTPSARP